MESYVRNSPRFKEIMKLFDSLEEIGGVISTEEYVAILSEVVYEANARIYNATSNESEDEEF